jgi:hypothetical protein
MVYKLKFWLIFLVVIGILMTTAFEVNKAQNKSRLEIQETLTGTTHSSQFRLKNLTQLTKFNPQSDQTNQYCQLGKNTTYWNSWSPPAYIQITNQKNANLDQLNQINQFLDSVELTPINSRFNQSYLAPNSIFNCSEGQVIKVFPIQLEGANVTRGAITSYLGSQQSDLFLEIYGRQKQDYFWISLALNRIENEDTACQLTLVEKGKINSDCLLQKYSITKNQPNLDAQTQILKNFFTLDN